VRSSGSVSSRGGEGGVERRQRATALALRQSTRILLEGGALAREEAKTGDAVVVLGTGVAEGTRPRRS
jgi:hypothetical protein